MRVLSIVTNGEARFYKQQVRGLRERGVEVDSVEIPGNRPEHTDNPERRSPANYVRFYADVFRRSFDDYDLLHASYGLTAPPAVLQPNLPVVLTLWGSDMLGHIAPLSWLCARGADEVIVQSTEMAEKLGRSCTILPHGIDTERFEPMDRTESREAIGWDQDRYQVLFPYSPDRDVKDYPRAERIVEAADERLERPVELQTITGVPHERMPLYMNAADALLLTSKREGGPNAVQEAMACNLPVVATDVGNAEMHLRDVEPSVVSDHDEELVDGLVDVLSGGERSNGRRIIEQYDLESQVDELHRIYQRAVDDS
ncbi:glycosyltransferase [Natronomonas salina]|uniref:glycosyltransferase n=1 Tax=Natronomonas salina TaxID=1710540 RepID=UPI0015B727C9|nr:glycosyltransferase [Natronomonas salina]QLD88692.1 glycosyltransferase [Natronomonas salina]